jgi:DNA-binding transcriptional LysR family regulator
MVARHKGLSIELQAARIGLFVEGIRCGDLDAAFFAGSAVPADMCGIELRKITFRIVAPALWQRRLEGASWSDTALMPWIRTTRPSAHHEMVTSVLEQLSIKPVEIVEADHELIVRSLIVAGLGIGLLREDVALEAQKAGEVIILGEETAQTTLSFVYLSNRAQDPSIRATARVLQEIWGLPEQESKVPKPVAG